MTKNLQKLSNFQRLIMLNRGLFVVKSKFWIKRLYNLQHACGSEHKCINANIINNAIVYKSLIGKEIIMSTCIVSLSVHLFSKIMSNSHFRLSHITLFLRTLKFVKCPSLLLHKNKLFSVVWCRYYYVFNLPAQVIFSAAGIISSQRLFLFLVCSQFPLM